MASGNFIIDTAAEIRQVFSLTSSVPKNEEKKRGGKASRATIKMSRYAPRCHFRTHQPLELDKRVEMDTVDRRKSTYIH